MKYKIGDVVKIKPLSYFTEEIRGRYPFFGGSMERFCCQELSIKEIVKVDSNQYVYNIKDYLWRENWVGEIKKGYKFKRSK